MRAKKVDANQSELVSQIRQIPGVSVAHTHTIGKGFPDLIIGWRGTNYLCEVKDGKKTASRKKLTLDEERFHQNWTGSIHIIESIQDVCDMLYSTFKMK